MAAQILSQDTLRNILEFDPETGVFTWKVNRGGTAIIGAKAGRIHPSGYVHIKYQNVEYLAHRLAWIHHHGKIDQSLVIDHINGIRNDNRIQNLRQVTHAKNMQNIGIKHTPSRLSLLLERNNPTTV